MKKVKFIYNPNSGEKAILGKIDSVIKVHQEYGYQVIPTRIDVNTSIEEIVDRDINEFEYVLVAGGDGTIDRAVNHMKKNNLDVPLAVLPMGTANDFAKLLGIPKDIEEACKQIIESDIEVIDLGRVNDKYFINVASSGLFTDVSQKIDVNFKNTMGKLAYYIKGFEEVSNLRKIHITMKTKEEEYSEDMYLFLVFNGQTAGNLKLAYKSSVNDGLLDVIIIKADAIHKSLRLFVDILKGNHLEKDNSIIYFQTDRVEIDCAEKDLITDIDGEPGPSFPLTITCEKDSLKMRGIKPV